MARPKILVLPLLLALGLPMPGSAAGSLAEEAVVTEGLIATAIAYEIGRRCDSLHPRMLAGIAFLNRLKSYAAGQGYTAAQIDAYVDDDAEQDRLEAIARARLAEKGGVVGDWATYCAVGRAEMAVGSQIGQLLR